MAPIVLNHKMYSIDGSTTATFSPRTSKIWVPGTDTLLPPYVDRPVLKPFPVDAELVLQDSQKLSSFLADDLSSDRANNDVPGNIPAGETGGLDEEETPTNMTAV